MNTSTSVKNQYLAIVARRPVSHLAAATFLATSVYVAHEGLQAGLPGPLAVALTALVVAVSVLQWLAHGRYEACLAERDTDRADAVMSQAWMFGAIETVLFAVGGLALCARDGLDVWNPAGICTAVVGAAVFAFANFRVKWTSCDAVTKRKPTPSADAIFAQPEPPPADKAPLSDPELSADDIGVVSLMDRIAAREAQAALDRKAMATVKKSAAQRLERATGRIRTRYYRAARKAAA
jgi:hypothetical protein